MSGKELGERLSMDYHCFDPRFIYHREGNRRQWSAYHSVGGVRVRLGQVISLMFSIIFWKILTKVGVAILSLSNVLSTLDLKNVQHSLVLPCTNARFFDGNAPHRVGEPATGLP